MLLIFIVKEGLIGLCNPLYTDNFDKGADIPSSHDTGIRLRKRAALK